MIIKKAAEFEPASELVKYFKNKKLACLAVKRGLDSYQKISEFIEPDKYIPLSFNKFPKLDQIVKFIADHIKHKNRILIYGDYDVDGITSTAILVGTLKDLGADVIYHLPDRFKEGYGLNQTVLAGYQSKVDLVISCDCGITNYAEVKFAKEIGLDFIVTDHHELPDRLPPADYVISPRMLGKDSQGYWLPGAGMAYYLVKALYNLAGDEKAAEDFLDLLLLAIIADVVPLQGENRYLFKTGLAKLRQTDRIGLTALYNELELNRSEINEKTLGFQIGPLLNSAGRIDSAEKGLKLLLAEDRQTAAVLAAELKSLNERRKKISQQIYQQLVETLNSDSPQPVVSYNSDWHQGVIGIAAGRVVENFNCPAVLMTNSRANDLITGSARSITGININQLINKCADLLEKNGGHAAAAGFSLKKANLEKFKLRLQRLLVEALNNQQIKPTIKADLNLEFAELNNNFYQKLRLFAPFGEANPEPIIYLEGEIISSREISAGKHKKFVLGSSKSSNSSRITALWWWGGNTDNNYRQQIACNLTENIYQGRKSLQLEIKALVSFQNEISQLAEANNSASKFDQMKVELIDWRQKDLELLKSGQPETAYFAEGSGSFKLNLYPIFNRNYYRQVKQLVILTIPPTPAILKEVILLTECERLILVNYRQQGTKEKFINLLMKRLKYCFEQENGIFNLNQAALDLATTVLTVKRGIDYLAAAGKLNYEFIAYQEILITKNGEVNRGQKNLRGSELTRLLSSTAAFRRFIKNKPIQQLQKFIDNLLNREI